jgi:hypothetical protein
MGWLIVERLKHKMMRGIIAVWKEKESFEN